MYIVAKTIKGKEYIYNNNYSILCSSKNIANKLCKHLIDNNKSAINEWQLKDNETWFVYQIDKYDKQPRYKLTSTKNKITIKEIGG